MFFKPYLRLSIQIVIFLDISFVITEMFSLFPENLLYIFYFFIFKNSYSYIWMNSRSYLSFIFL